MQATNLRKGRTRLASLAAASAMALAAWAASAQPADAATNPQSNVNLGPTQPATDNAMAPAADYRGRRACWRVRLPSGRVVWRCRWSVSDVPTGEVVLTRGLE